uniref:Uncharacterized protein n=1 Tax=Ciona intestinalis TaxID=7719 RepID=H2XY15_CIOIN
MTGLCTFQTGSDTHQVHRACHQGCHSSASQPVWHVILPR